MKPVIALTDGRKLTKREFLEYFEKKVFRTIRQYKLIGRKEHVGVAVSGGKDSLTVLSLLKTLEHPGMKLSAILADEGISGYRDDTILSAQAFCKKLKVPLHITSFEDAFGMRLEDALKKIEVKPCTLCGIFRRYLLNKKAKELGCAVLATGHNLDDEAQSILMNQFRNDLKASARFGPMTGTRQKGFVSRIKPLYFCLEKEVTTYAFLKGILDEFTECPNVVESFRAQVRDVLNTLEAAHPGSKHALVHSFLEMLPLLKKKHGGEPLGVCPECGEPSAKGVCNACVWGSRVKEFCLRMYR